jgi:hypothetical protein
VSEAAAPRAGEGAFTARTVIALLIAGVFAFSAFVALSAYAPDLRGGSDGGGHALSRSAIGYAGMVRLLKTMGEPVLVSRDAKARTASTSLLVLTPPVDVDKDALNNLTATGPTLIVMPKWVAAPDMRNPGWVAKVGALDPGAVAKVLDKRFVGVSIVRDKAVAPMRLLGLPGGPVLTGPIDQLQTIGGDPDPILKDADGRAILSKSDDGRVFILSDPDLLNTQGIKDLATARAGVAILQSVRGGDGPIIFDVTLDGLGRSRNLAKLAFEPPFLGATICLGAAALLVALQALTRFGAPRRAGRAIALGKLALADNSAGLIRLARREPRMAGRYLELIRASVARALGASPQVGADLNAQLDRQAERIGASRQLATLTAEADAVKDRAGLMRLARNLYQWKTEMTGERR